MTLERYLSIYHSRIEMQYCNYYGLKKVKLYAIEVVSAFSQFLNVLLFKGSTSFTIAADAHRLNKPKLVKFLNFVFSPLERDHCKRSYYYDIAKARIVIETHERSSIT